MERQAECPHCHGLIEVPSGTAYGTAVTCAHCGKAWKVAAGPEGAEQVTLADTERVG
jgi:hypothetical protein